MSHDEYVIALERVTLGQMKERLVEIRQKLDHDKIHATGLNRIGLNRRESDLAAIEESFGEVYAYFGAPKARNNNG